MTRQQIRETLNRIYVNLPQDFNMREVKFYVYQALQKLGHVEKKEERRQQTAAQFIHHHQQPVTSFNQNPYFLKEKIDIINQMIQGEEKKIADISVKKGKTNGPTDNIQTYLG